MAERMNGIILTYLNVFFGSLFAVIYIPLLLYYMGESEFGLYQLMGSIIAYFGIMDFGINNAVVRCYTKYKTLQDNIKMENILAIAQYCYGFIALLMLTGGIVIYDYFEDIFGYSLNDYELKSARYIFVLLFFNIIVTVITSVYKAVINAHEKYLFLKGLETLQILLQPILVVMIMQVSPTAIGVAFVQTLLNLTLSIGRIYYCFKILNIRIRYHYFNREVFNEFGALAISVFFVAITDQIFWHGNKLILGIMIGTKEVAIYSIAVTIYMSYMCFSTAITSVFLPKITQMVTQNVDLRNLSEIFIRLGRVQYFILACILSGFILFGREFIVLWVGAGYINAYYIAVLILFPVTIDLIQNICNCILQAQNKYKDRAKVLIFTGLFSLVLAVPLAHEYKEIGCAVAVALGMFIGNGIVMNFYYSRITKLDVYLFWKNILKITIWIVPSVCVGLGLNVMFCQSSSMILIIRIFLYGVIYFCIMWKFAMNLYEKGLFISVLQKMNNLISSFYKK